MQALTASVLRDLASDNPANRDAILKAGGLHELVRQLVSIPRPLGCDAAGCGTHTHSHASC